MTKYLFLPILLFLTTASPFNSSSNAGDKHDLLYWAELLVSHIDPQHTDYRHKEISVTWAGSNSATGYESFADCSGFINALFKQTYG